MTKAVMMTETERNNAILLTTMELNERVRELEQTVAQSGNSEIVKDLSRVADSLALELRDSILELVRQNLGPEQQDNLMLVLRKAGEWLAAERAELQRPPQQGLRISTHEAARRLRDLDYFEVFLQKLATDILRIMADYNYRHGWRK